MSMSPETANALSDVAKELPRAMAKAAAQSAAEVAAGVTVLLVVGYAYSVYTERKAKKLAKKNAE
jgi:hypothetical protein